MQVLERVRGTSNVDLEFEELVEIVAASKAVPNSFRNLLLDPRYRPQLFVVILMPIAQQVEPLTGRSGSLFQCDG